MMRVVLYLPDRLYGFCKSNEGGGQVFFHASVFHRLHDTEPPPILGEPVEVQVGALVSGVAPRATEVRRSVVPIQAEGKVVSFDAAQGWGFVRDDRGQDLFLHRADILDGRLPIRGQRVRFYVGSKNDRPRACYVEV
jgi:cold shock CspA family protein